MLQVILLLLTNFGSHDPKQGFVYDRRPDVTAGSLASGGKFPSIQLVNKPEIAKGGKGRRLTSAFTVERLSPYDIQNVNQALQNIQDEQLARRVIETLEGKKLGDKELNNIVALDNKGSLYLTHEGKIANKKAAIWIADDDLTIGSFDINGATKEAMNQDYSHLIVVGFSYAVEHLSESTKKGANLRLVALCSKCTFHH